MIGRIIYEPPESVQCHLRGDCEGKPPAADYRDGTIWCCDNCDRRWEKWSGAQYNESFDSWREVRQ